MKILYLAMLVTASAYGQWITGYYQGDGATKIKQRKELAARWGLQLNALRIRACRVRAKLEACMERCLTASHKNEIVTDFPAGNE